jgi:hypothetical protein
MADALKSDRISSLFRAGRARAKVKERAGRSALFSHSRGMSLAPMIVHVRLGALIHNAITHVFSISYILSTPILHRFPSER